MYPVIPPDEIWLGIHSIVDGISRFGTFHKVRWMNHGHELNASVFGQELLQQIPLGVYASGKYQVAIKNGFLNVIGIVEKPVPIWEHSRTAND